MDSGISTSCGETIHGQSGTLVAGVRPYQAGVLAGAAIVVVALEILAYRSNGWFEQTAAWAWAAFGLVFLAIASIEIVRTVAHDLRRRNRAAGLLLLITAAAVIPGLGGVEILPIYQEAPREVAWGIESFGRQGWGYTGIGHIGYPNRQFLIAAVPSVVLGRGLVPLRLGFGLPFVVGILLFWVGSRRLLDSSPDGRILAPIAAIAVLALPYAVLHLHNYEQTLFPLAATLAATGWLALTVRRPSVPRFLCLAWIGALLGTSYTPNIASWLLMIVACGWLTIRAWIARQRPAAITWLSVATIVTMIGAFSFNTRLDFFKPETGTVKPDVVEPLAEGLSIFFFGEPETFFPGVLWIAVMAVLIAGLTGRLRAVGFVVCGWVVGTVAAACVLIGYSIRPMATEMFRALVVVPPLLLLTAWAVDRWRLGFGLERLPTRSMKVFCVLLVAQVGWNLAAAAVLHRPTISELVYADMVEQYAEMEGRNHSPPVIVLDTERPEFDNTGDYLPYFFPGHELIRREDALATLADDTRAILYYADQDRADRDERPWPDASGPRFLSYEHPYHGCTVVGWSRPPRNE